MDYMIRFVGHIVERSRPDGFPKEIYSDLYVRADNPSGLKAAINQHCQVFINEGCMIVPKNPDEVEESVNVKYDSRIIVPWHMIAYISTITKRIIGEIPQLNEQNKPEVSDGSKVQIQ
jgi:hypothetical protein